MALTSRNQVSGLADDAVWAETAPMRFAAASVVGVQTAALVLGADTERAFSPCIGGRRAVAAMNPAAVGAAECCPAGSEAWLRSALAAGCVVVFATRVDDGKVGIAEEGWR
jgi:hypothetical protein